MSERACKNCKHYFSRYGFRYCGHPDGKMFDRITGSEPQHLTALTYDYHKVVKAYLAKCDRLGWFTEARRGRFFQRIFNGLTARASRETEQEHRER